MNYTVSFIQLFQSHWQVILFSGYIMTLALIDKKDRFLTCVLCWHDSQSLEFHVKDYAGNRTRDAGVRGGNSTITPPCENYVYSTYMYTANYTPTFQPCDKSIHMYRYLVRMGTQYTLWSRTNLCWNFWNFMHSILDGGNEVEEYNIYNMFF